MKTIFLIHLFACFCMTGIIWVVQLLIYPSFKIVGRTEFKIFHDFHIRKISLVVAPLILLELITAMGLTFYIPGSLTIFNLAFVVLLLCLTFFKNIPTHNKLNFDLANTKQDLIFWNWPRTFLWTIRFPFLLYLGINI